VTIESGLVRGLQLRPNKMVSEQGSRKGIFGILLCALLMASGGLIPGSLPIFDGKGYDDWCVKMDAILGFQEIDEIVKVGFKEPPKNADEEVKKTYKEMKKLDCKARVLLHQSVVAPIFQKISKVVTTKEV